MTSPIANSILYPSIIDITESLHTTKFLSNALISISTFFNGIAPLGWASYSEVYETRKKAYVISLLLFMITSITCAVATNIWLLLIMRGLQASGVSAALCIGAGTISDIYIPTERGTAYGYFSLVIVIGPIIGPIVGGYITDYLGWRWIFWFLSIFGSLTLISLFFISETYNSKITFTIKHDDMMKKKKFNPFLPLYMFKYPNKFYGLSPSKAGLVFISLGLGQILGNVIGGKWSDIVLIKFKNKNNGKLIPEQRINSIWLGSIIIPLIFIAYGWLIERKSGA
uniref:Major facilitator superfamily (MFS) profile domain-containing protein n=1 Tax=Rhizophagus irregularis (strain DAOM 181602 / DAOM 197198 / MUCL 43194) TaxID=747089 RepID=U9TE48_RHIID